MKRDSSDSHAFLRCLGLYGCAFAGMALLLVFMFWPSSHQQPGNGFQAPDEKLAAQLLLAQKLSGPGYFKLDPRSTPVPFPFITRGNALRQVDRIVRERDLTPSQRTKLETLIDQLVEPPSSRMLGDERINGLRLNLSLDKMP